MEPKKRIGYIDALRGFTIILVVLQHIVSMYFRPNELNPLYLWLQQVRMPLFFFVSGLVFYKVQRTWNLKECVLFFKKKTTVQIISPAIFMLLYFLYLDINIVDGVLNKSKCGYWFTYTLFTYFIFYITTQKTALHFRINGYSNDILILSTGILVCLISLHSTSWDKSISGLLSAEKWKYYIFFILGTLAKKESSLFTESLDKRLLIPICIILFTTINIILNDIPSTAAKIVLQTTGSILGILILFSVFKKLDRYLTDNKVTGRTMQFIGRRTLDIYLIHFFFVYSPIGAALREPQFTDTTAKVLYILFNTVLVVSLSLAAGAVLRINNKVAHLLFGAKRVK